MELESYELCDTPSKKIRGLMFRKKHKKTLLFVFSKPGRVMNAIHSFFVFFPFDAVWLDEEKRVIQVQRIKPFTFIAYPKRPAKYLLEMPIGKAKRIHEGQKINFKEP